MASQRKTGAILGYANIVVKNIVNLLYTPMLLAFVGQADYGVFQTANNFIVSLQLLAFGFSGAYVRFFMRRAAKDDTEGIKRLNGMYALIYVLIAMVAVVLGLIFAVNCGILFSGSFTPDQVSLATGVMAILTFNVATTLLSTVFDAYIVAHERFSFQQSRQMFTSLAIPGFALIMLSRGWGVIGVSLAQLAVNLILLALNAHYAIGKLGMRFSFRDRERGLFRAVAVFSGWLFLNQVFDLITMNAPSVVLAAVAGATPVAIFAIAASLRSVFYSLSTTVSSLFVPLVNRIVAERDDNRELTQLMVHVGRYQALVYCWVLGGFAVVGQWFIDVWAGPDYLQAYWLTLAMMVPATIPLIQNTGIEIQKAKNKHKVRSVVYLICASVDLLVTFLLASTLGAWAAAIGYVVYILLGPGIFMNWYYVRGIGLNIAYFWKQLLPMIFVFAAVSAVCMLGTSVVPVSGILQFLGWGAVYTLACGAALWLLVLNDEEKDRGRSLMKKVKVLHD